MKIVTKKYNRRLAFTTTIGVQLGVLLSPLTAWGISPFLISPPEILKEFLKMQEDSLYKAKQAAAKITNPEIRKDVEKALQEVGQTRLTLASESEKIEKEKQNLRLESNRLRQERDELQLESNRLRQERDELQLESNRLRKETDELLLQKADLENSERLFSMGFYASLLAALVAIVGILIRFPTLRLERRLKMLEIAEKERAIKERENSVFPVAQSLDRTANNTSLPS